MRGGTCLVALLASIAAGTLAAPAVSREATDLVVHEWGTFTSIAGADGRAAEWLPSSHADDLPRFVRRRSFGPKGRLRGTVRMETPVVYFYAAHDRQVTVRARFRNGVITEWYPRAMVTPAADRDVRLTRSGFEGQVAWRDVDVLAHGRAELPVESAPSHYYAARETDASIVAVAGQREKFLFYRGVGNFIPPIEAMVRDDDSVVVSTVDRQPLGPVVMFERKDERIAYDLHHVAGSTSTFSSNPPAGTREALFAELEGLLVAHGLYPREAKAMLATWEDSWFEEGTRLFYVVPRPFIDAVLPLDVDPLPVEAARVFVGRVELFPNATLDEVRQAMTRRDDVALEKYGRFLHYLVSRVN